MDFLSSIPSHLPTYHSSLTSLFLFHLDLPHVTYTLIFELLEFVSEAFLLISERLYMDFDTFQPFGIP